MILLPSELLKEGGPWLGAARAWLQWNKHNGSDVIWGSEDTIKPTMTVRDCEELAAAAVAADRMEREKVECSCKKLKELNHMLNFVFDEAQCDCLGTRKHMGEMCKEFRERRYLNERTSF
jgi:hypothetical protein